MFQTTFDYKTIYLSISDDDDVICFGESVELMKPVINNTRFVADGLFPATLSYDSGTYSLFDIDSAMNAAYERNRDRIQSKSIRPIANGIYAYYNSLNILVGNQGRGKSHIVLRDIIQISRLKNKLFGEASGQSLFHQIVNISKNGTINDSTFEAQRELIQLLIKSVSDKDAEKYLKDLDYRKSLYDQYCSKPQVSKDSDKLNQMFEFRQIDEH